MKNEGLGCCFLGTIILGFFYWPLWILSLIIAILAASDNG